MIIAKQEQLFMEYPIVPVNGTTVSNGAAFLHTTASTVQSSSSPSSSSSTSNGKLHSINNLVIIFKSQADRFKNIKITGWE